MNKSINNKGFTLVELLAVFVILISVSFVTVGGVTASLEKREFQECVEQQKLAVAAAKIYFSLEGDGKKEVSISVLKNNGYFRDGKKIDRLNDDDKIRFTSNGYTYNGSLAGDSCN